MHDDTLVFTAEGDLWETGIDGGLARRLTTHPEQEVGAAISPDGSTIAFTASYEGASEVYVMPSDGGRPKRLTWNGGRCHVAGWTPGGEVVYVTSAYRTLPGAQLVRIDPSTGARTLIPLQDAAEATWDDSGRTLYFTRYPFQGSHTKRYKGGAAQSIWRFADGDSEAVPLTAGDPGTSRNPMWWDGRIWFVSDRDGTMNLWSMRPDGSEARQESFHTGWDVKEASLSRGRIAYQLGADLWLHDIGTGEDRKLEIRLASDFDQMRETWVDKPMDYLSAAHISPDGDRLVLTARGQVFVAPVKAGRLVEATRASGIRYRDARFLADGKGLAVLSDESGEVEYWRLPADGVGTAAQITHRGGPLRFGGPVSPDGAWIATQDKDRELRVVHLEDGSERRVAQSEKGGFSGLAWSPDSRWLAYVTGAENDFSRIWIYDTRSGDTFPVTTDRYDDTSPSWSPDGRWLYFLSDRRLSSLTRGVWGTRAPEPYLDRSTGIYLLALRAGLRSPFREPDELHPQDADSEDIDSEDAGSEDAGSHGSDANSAKRGKGQEQKSDKGDKGKDGTEVEVRIDRDGILERIEEVPIDPGNYEDLTAAKDRLFFVSRTTETSPQRDLEVLQIDWEQEGPKTLVEKIRDYELSPDGSRILLRKGDGFHVFPSGASAPADLSKSAVDLSGWTFPFDPVEERRQMFTEAWRLERDYFYDPAMHGVDWQGMLEKYLPLVDRVTDRNELNDLLGQMVGELSALHTYVYGGDAREGTDDILPSTLGALLERDEADGGYRIRHIYRTDPDRPWTRSPLLQADRDLHDGDRILSINGVDLRTVPDPGDLLRHEAGRQVRLQVVSGSGGAKPRDLIVKPLSPRQDRALRYDAWEFERRQLVEDWGAGRIGYVHLRAMGASDFEDWAREFYPVWNRDGLIIDLRNNDGGNIDSWILSRLLRRAWMWWKPRVGDPDPNMQYAFTGHLAVIVNAQTISDGEAFAEGFRRLGLGPVIGSRTWGGEIWLTYSNTLVDGGIATAAEFGVYGPEGTWLIEGHGVDPDIAVENLPHATFEGADAQLRAAVDELLRKIREEPVTRPAAPRYPDKSFTPPNR